MKLTKEKLITIGFLAVIFILLLSLITRESINTSKINSLKETILSKDSLYKVRDGQYTKLVNDTKSKSELTKEVKSELPQTYQDIKKAKENIISHTKVSVAPKSTTTIDTVYIDTLGIQKFDSYYPNKDNYFVKHKSTIDKNVATNLWEFNSLKLDIVVTQQKDGMYRARLAGPEWIEANEVTVNSLPLTPLTERKLKFLLGGSGGYSMNDRNIVLGIYSGIRYKSNIILIHGGTNKVISGGFIKEF